MAALLDAVSAGLRHLPHVKLDRLPRMADFATWVTACEPALGWEPGSFLRVYRHNVKDANELVLECSPVTRYIFGLADGGEWSGTAGELLAAIEDLLRALRPQRQPKKRATA